MHFRKGLCGWRGRGLAFFFCYSFFLILPALALNVEISQPKDEFVTFKDLVFLEGKVSDAKGLKINGATVDFGPDGSFNAGLALNRGKNLVEVVAVGANGEVVKETRKVLRLINFPDVEEGMLSRKKQPYWARDRIIEMASLGLVEAYPDNNFYPQRHLSRGELATWLCWAKKLKTSAVEQDVFYDVPKEHWRAPYIQTVVALNYMRGFENDLFWIEDGIFRGKAAEVLVRANGRLLTGEAWGVFEDVPVTHPDAFWICQAHQKGFVIGISNRRRIFDADRFITRAEGVMLLSRDPMVKPQVDELFNMSSGFTDATKCFINTAPKVEWVKVEPDKIYVKEKKVVVFTAKVVDYEGMGNVANVTVDLTALKGPPDAEMYDDGTNGDANKNDGIYSLKIVAEPPKSQEVKIRVKAVDKYTFEGTGSTTLMIVE